MYLKWLWLHWIAGKIFKIFNFVMDIGASRWCIEYFQFWGANPQHIDNIGTDPRSSRRRDSGDRD